MADSAGRYDASIEPDEARDLDEMDPMYDIGVPKQQKASASAPPPYTSQPFGGTADGYEGGASSSYGRGPIGADINLRDRTNRNIDTLEEPVLTTIINDAKDIGRKVVYVLYPRDAQVLRNWDLWGPLLFSLCMSLCLSLTAPPAQSTLVFTGIFTLVWFGQAVCTVNIGMLGADLSFFQSVCILGYATAPLVIAAFVGLFVKLWFVKLPLALAMYIWSIFAALGVVHNTNLPGRKLLAVYPLCLYYFALAWIIFCSA